MAGEDVRHGPFIGFGPDRADRIADRDYPVPCEWCETLTHDWRSVGFFCSDECKAEYARHLTL